MRPSCCLGSWYGSDNLAGSGLGAESNRLGEAEGVAELSFRDGLPLGAAPHVVNKNSRICRKKSASDLYDRPMRSIIATP